MELQVGVKALLRNKEGKYLLLHRIKEKYPEVTNLWDIPGGRIDPGTPLMENLSREVKEETGLVISGEARLIAAQDILKSRHVVRLTYVAECETDAVQLDGSEHDSFKWCSLNELDQDGVDSYVRKAINSPLAQFLLK